MVSLRINEWSDYQAYKDTSHWKLVEKLVEKINENVSSDTVVGTHGLFLILEICILSYEREDVSNLMKDSAV